MNKKSIITTALLVALIASPSLAEAKNLLKIKLSASATTTASIKIKEQNLTGTVKSISGYILAVLAYNGGTYNVDATNAKLVRRYGAPMQIGDFQINDIVQVRGTIDADNVKATYIKDLSLQAYKGTFTGKVLSVSGSNFVLQSAGRGNQTINTNASTTITKNGQPAQFSDITVGATVKVHGVWDRTNSNVTALKVNIEVKLIQANLAGTVTAISLPSSTLTVKGNNQITYIVDASKAKLVRRYGAAMQMSDFQVNDIVQIKGTVNGSNIAATYIRDISLQARNGAFTGKVLSIMSGSSFDIQSNNRSRQTINTTASTTITKNGKPALFSDITVGATVYVVGVWNRTNSNVTALRVNIIERMVGINFRGALTAVSSSTLTVLADNKASYTVDASKARIMNRNGKKITLADLKIGDQLQVQGKHVVQSTNIIANWVRDLSLLRYPVPLSAATSTPPTPTSTASST